MHAVPYKTLGGSMSLFGWMLGLSYLALLFRHRERAVGPFLIPFVILFSTLGLLLPQAAPAARPDTQGTVFALHVTFAILGYAAFTFSSRAVALLPDPEPATEEDEERPALLEAAGADATAE